MFVSWVRPDNVCVISTTQQCVISPTRQCLCHLYDPTTFMSLVRPDQGHRASIPGSVCLEADALPLGCRGGQTLETSRDTDSYCGSFFSVCRSNSPVPLLLVSSWSEPPRWLGVKASSSTAADLGPVSWGPMTVKWRQFSQSNRHSTIGTRQTEYHEALPSSVNDEVRCDCTFADDGSASWYLVCRVPMVEWRLDCENCRHWTVVGLHDTDPWGRFSVSPWILFRVESYQWPRNRYSSSFPARHPAFLDQRWDWLASCDRMFDPQFLSQCSSTYSGLSRPVPGMHFSTIHFACRCTCCYTEIKITDHPLIVYWHLADQS